MRVFDLAAAATVVDIGRHQPKLISATRPLVHSATGPRRHVAFLDKPFIRSFIFSSIPKRNLNIRVLWFTNTYLGIFVHYEIF